MKSEKYFIPFVSCVFFACSSEFLPLDEDIEAPRIKETVPKDGEKEVSVDSGVKVYFSETISAETVSKFSVALFLCSDANAIKGQISYELSKNMVEFVPEEPLKEGACYSVYVSKAIQDKARLPLDTGGAQSVMVQFTTEADPPEVVDWEPREDEIDTEAFNEIKIYFSEQLDPSTVTPHNILLYDTVGNVSYDEENYAIILSLAEPIVSGKLYRFYLTTNITDFSGIPLENEFALKFRAK